MMDRKEILKGLIGRLSRGESMEEVRGECLPDGLVRLNESDEFGN